MEPMTPEQLEFFTEQTRRAVRKSVSRYTRGAVVGFLFLLLGLSYALHAQSVDSHSSRHAIVQSGRAVAVDSCNGRYEDREGLRNLLLSAKKQIEPSVQRGEASPEQGKRALAFYDSQLARLKLPDCRRAITLITANPRHEISIPTPLHPPDAPLPTLHDAILHG